MVILDSPVYKLPRAWRADARRAPGTFSRQQYGFRSEALRSIEFFDEAMLRRTRARLGIALADSQALVRIALACCARGKRGSGTGGRRRVSGFSRGCSSMIVLLHPRSTRPKNRRFPLSVLASRRVLEGKEEYEIVDGNIDPGPMATIDRIAREQPAEMLGVSRDAGSADGRRRSRSRKEFRARYPKVPIVWGGYFPSLYPDAALNALVCRFAGARPGRGHDSRNCWARCGMAPRFRADRRESRTRTRSGCMCTRRSGPSVHRAIFRGCRTIVCAIRRSTSRGHFSARARRCTTPATAARIAASFAA